MRTIAIAVLAAFLGIAAAGSLQGQAQPYGASPGSPGQYDPYGWQGEGDWGDQEASVDVGFFYDELSPYGEWVRHPHYGWVWFPRHVRAGWRPYSLGYWVGSDYGWTWVSDEPFGWATYHYGRWAWDPWLGWLWVPGTDWGPAWVAWQHGNGYIGWAPLPPAVGFQIGIGIRLGDFDLSIGLAPRDYAFVEERRFLDRHVYSHFVPEARNVTIIHVTTNVTNYTVVDNRVINHGVPIERVERATGRRTPRLRVATAPGPGIEGVQRDTVRIYRPNESRLQSVRVARRNNPGLPPAPADQGAPVQPPTARTPGGRPAEGGAPVAIPVAPRSRPRASDDSDRQFQREQRELAARLEKERRALEQAHRKELAQAARAKADAQEVARRHAAEQQAQREQRQRAAQQLKARQQLERQAAEATAARPHRGQRPAAEPDEPKPNERRKGKKGEQPAPTPPPPSALG